jgi:hypothetical protein
MIVARQGMVVVNPCRFFCTLKIEIPKKAALRLYLGNVPVPFRERKRVHSTRRVFVPRNFRKKLLYFKSLALSPPNFREEDKVKTETG